jgi:hypothetical protein
MTKYFAVWVLIVLAAAVCVSYTVLACSALPDRSTRLEFWATLGTICAALVTAAAVYVYG